MQVQGPRSKDVLQTLFGDRVTGLKYYWCTEADLDGIPVVVSRTGWTGEVGFEIYLRDGSRGDELWERVMEAGRPHDIRPIAPCEARRLEAGIFNYQSDIRLENNPFEVMGLERLVDLDKEADYVGKEALRRIHAEGVSRKLVGVDLPGEAMDFELSEAWPVLGDDDRQIGRVTDAIWSPRLERNIGYVWVPIDLAATGTPIRVRTPQGEIEAHTAAIPFLDPTKKVPAAYAPQ
jgi:aminomethyltransferase